MIIGNTDYRQKACCRQLVSCYTIRMSRKFALLLKSLFLVTLLGAFLAVNMAIAVPKLGAASSHICDAHVNRLEVSEVAGVELAFPHCPTEHLSCPSERCPSFPYALSAPQSGALAASSSSKRPILFGQTAMRALLRGDNLLRPPKA